MYFTCTFLSNKKYENLSKIAFLLAFSPRANPRFLGEASAKVQQLTKRSKSFDHFFSKKIKFAIPDPQNCNFTLQKPPLHPTFSPKIPAAAHPKIVPAHTQYYLYTRVRVRRSRILKKQTKRAHSHCNVGVRSCAVVGECLAVSGTASFVSAAVGFAARRGVLHGSERGGVGADGERVGRAFGHAVCGGQDGTT